MKMPFFASFIIFIIWLTYELAKSRRRAEKKQLTYWEKENRANSTRRKPLDDLDYITIPFDDLPLSAMAENQEIQEYIKTLHSLAEAPIVNFTGITNTDLKLQYGAPNIDLLMRYDQSYTTLACTLQKWAQKLYEAGYITEAKRVLEFAISTDTDVSNSYRLLASIYHAEGDYEKIARLKDRAQNLKSGSRNLIVRILQEYGQ